MWTWLAVASAHDLELEGQVRGLLKGLVPEIESTAGRRFDHLPRIVFTDPVSEMPRLVEEFSQTMPADRAFDTAALLVAASFAAYLPASDEVVVFADNLDAIADPDGTLRADVLRCTIAHELVHALQAQQLPDVMSSFDDDTLMQRIAIEGQAAVLGERACGRPAGTGYLRWASGGWARPGTTGPVGLWGPGELLYGWGSRWVERRIALGGPAAAWSLVADPPSFDVFEAEVLEDLGSEFAHPEWPSPADADAACDAVGSAAGKLSRRFGGPTHRNDPNYPWWPGSYQDWELVAYLRTVTSWRCANGVEFVAIDAVGAGPTLAGRTIEADRVRRRDGVVWIDDHGIDRWESSGDAHHVVIYPYHHHLGVGRARGALRALGRSDGDPYDAW